MFVLAASHHDRTRLSSLCSACCMCVAQDCRQPVRALHAAAAAAACRATRRDAVLSVLGSGEFVERAQVL